MYYKESSTSSGARSENNGLREGVRIKEFTGGLRFEEYRPPQIAQYKRFLIQEIKNCIRIEFGRKYTEDQLLALGSYPVDDLLEYERKCIVYKGDYKGKKVIMLRWKGSHIENNFLLGHSEAMQEVIRIYPQEGLEMETKTFNFVVADQDFNARRTARLHREDKWYIDNEATREYIRMLHKGKQYLIEEPILDSNHQIARVGSGISDSNKLDELYGNDPETSYSPEHVKRHEIFYAVLNLETKQFDSASGVIGSVGDVKPIYLVGDMFTRKGFRNNDYALGTRMATLYTIYDELADALVIADANRHSLPVNRKAGFVRLMKFKWLTLRRK